MWKLSTAVAVLLVVSLASKLTSAQEVVGRLNFNAGEPRKGAFCSEDAKHLILEAIAKQLVMAQSSKINADDYDEWCTTICYPGNILFCELMTEKCREMKQRRHLSEEAELPFGEASTAAEVDEDTSLVIFNESAVKHGGHRHVRRSLQSGRITENLSDAENVVCSTVKGPLMRAISDELGSKLDTLCIRLLRQKLLLDCVVFK